MQPSVFISYNPNALIEETLALRLHTIGAVNGLRMFLPERIDGVKGISLDTKNRINFSDYYILFSTTRNLSKVALEEIQFAFRKHNDKSRIIIIYDAAEGKNMQGTDNCTELFFDRKKYTVEKFISMVMNKIMEHHEGQSKKQTEALGGLLLAGLGLLLLGAAFSGNK